MDETSEIENCETVDLGDPFEDYDGAASQFQYGDNNIHKECIRKKETGDNKPDDKTLLKIQYQKKKELIK